MSHSVLFVQCGGTYHTGVCNVCMAPIGGASGEPLDGNKLTNTYVTITIPIVYNLT